MMSRVMKTLIASDGREWGVESKFRLFLIAGRVIFVQDEFQQKISGRNENGENFRKTFNHNWVNKDNRRIFIYLFVGKH